MKSIYIFKTRLTKCRENDLSPKLADVKKKGQVVLAINVPSMPALHLSGQEVTPNTSCGSSFKSCYSTSRQGFAHSVKRRRSISKRSL